MTKESDIKGVEDEFHKWLEDEIKLKHYRELTVNAMITKTASLVWDKCQIKCRRCKESMWQPGTLKNFVWYCSKCHEKAQLSYSKTPKVRLKNKSHGGKT